MKYLLLILLAACSTAPVTRGFLDARDKQKIQMCNRYSEACKKNADNARCEWAKQECER